MFIVKPGRRFGELLRFICSECGCEFIADAADYYETQINSFMLARTIDVIECVCPTCGEKIRIRADMKDKCVVEED